MTKGAGHFGHTKACECERCVKAKVEAFMDRIEDRSRYVPESRDQTVAVRAHWRRNPHHLKKQSRVRSALQIAIDAMRKRQRNGSTD